MLKKKQGILLVNLGSPDSPSVADVRKYLAEFLMDGRVIDIPWVVRWLLIHLIILPSRPARSAKAYQKIWTEAGSPLVAISQEVHEQLQAALVETPVALGMRYGNPSIAMALKELFEKNVQEILLIPLYPHYAMSSYETVVIKTQSLLKKWAPQIHLQILPPFYDEPHYVQALVENTRPFLEKGYDHLLFSYHGIPVRHLIKTDTTGQHCQMTPNCCEVAHKAHQTCYRFQVFKTTQAFVKMANIPENKYSIAFQSRLGRTPWLSPFTDMVLPEMPQKGIKKLLVICPSFVSDCLETLEEIQIRGKETFIEAGGESLTLVPCLNTHPLWIDTLKHWCQSGITENSL